MNETERLAIQIQLLHAPVAMLLMMGLIAVPSSLLQQQIAKMAREVLYNTQPLVRRQTPPDGSAT